MSATTTAALRSCAPETEEIVDAYRDLAAPVTERAEDADFTARWRAMADLGVLRLAPPGATTPGPVTRALAMIEGIGLAGVDPGVCYALASQVFGMQFPLGHAPGSGLGRGRRRPGRPDPALPRADRTRGRQ